MGSETRVIALVATVVALLPASATGAPFVATDSQNIKAPGWIAESDQDYAHLGTSVAGAGDVNGDGYGDVSVRVQRLRDRPLHNPSLDG